MTIAYLIDPEKHTVEAVEVDVKNKLDDAYKHLKTDMVECVYLPNGDMLLVDEEGLLKQPKHFFKHNDYHQPIAGRGLYTQDFCNKKPKASMDKVINSIGFSVPDSWLQSGGADV